MALASVAREQLTGRRYTSGMRSVADDLREDTRRRMQRLSAVERVRIALELGDADAAALAAARRITVAEARAVIARSRSIGRRPSCANAR